MPFSLLLHGYPTTEVPVAHVQGPALQGMFLHLMREIDPAVCQRLHENSRYRPYTLSPLGIGEPDRNFQGYWLSRQEQIRRGAPCFVRITLLEDALFTTFSQYFLNRQEPTFRLGVTEFVVTNVMGENYHPVQWNRYTPYPDMIKRTSSENEKITLQFLTPTSFSYGDVDLPLPFPRLVFQSFMKRFEEFYQVAFLPDFADQVERYAGISNLYHVNTEVIRTKKVHLVGFTGKVTYQISKKASPDLIFQMNLLAEYAFFCGTGKKTTIGMGQTVKIKKSKNT